VVAASPEPFRNDVTIHEPATLATDLLLAGLGGGLAWRLRKKVTAENRAALWWCGALGAMAVSALAGGLYHGFAPNFHATVDGVWWRVVLGLICVMGLTMAESLVHEIAPDRRGWRWVVRVKFLLSVAAVMVWPDFRVAMADYGLAMLAWVAAALLLRGRWSAWMLSGVGLSAVAGWVQQSGWGLSPGFNHNDVFHVIQALALVGFYRAGCGLGER
jgi:hypothetical protein